MSRIRSLFLVASVSFVANIFATDMQSPPGYWGSAYKGLVRDAYGNCVHTIYFNQATDGIAECDEQIVSVEKKPRVVVETVTINDSDHVLFKFNESTLTSEGVLVLDTLARHAESNHDVTAVTIDGYTDGIGAFDYNMKLSQARAGTVKDLFVSQGIDVAKITTHGMGDTGAKVTKQCMAQYGSDPQGKIREVEIKLASNKFKAKTLSKALLNEKKSLETKLATLSQARVNLISCAAPDRKVVFTIEHTEQVETMVNGTSSVTSAAAVAS